MVFAGLSAGSGPKRCRALAAEAARAAGAVRVVLTPGGALVLRHLDGSAALGVGAELAELQNSIRRVTKETADVRKLNTRGRTAHKGTAHGNKEMKRIILVQLFPETQ